MAASEVKFIGTDQPVYYPPTIDICEKWDDPWEPLENAHPIEATWSIAPTMPTASIIYRYGSVITPGSTVWEKILKKRDIQRFYVRIKFPVMLDKFDPDLTDEDKKEKVAFRYWEWYGLLELDEDDLGGAVFQRARRNQTNVTATGYQVFSCVGLEYMLANHQVRSSWIKDGGSAVEIPRALTFNRLGRPNRTLNQFDGTYLFEPDHSTAHYWTTKDIVEYLILRQVPRDKDGVIKVPWILMGMALPAWDRPEVPQENCTTYSLINQVVNRQLMLGWKTRFILAGDQPVSDKVAIEVFSLADSDIVLPLSDAPTIERNYFRKHVIFDTDPLTTATVKDSSVEWADQCIWRGATKISVGSFSLVDTTWTIAWNTELQEAYNTGASTQGDYTSLEDEEKRRRNAIARSSPRLEEVYSLFKIPLAWNRKVKDGVGGTENPMFPDGVGGTKKGYYAEMFVQHTLPLVAGQDYSGTRIADGLATLYDPTIHVHNEDMPPMVFFQRGTTDRWIAADKMGQIGSHVVTDAFSGGDIHDNRFSCSVRVPHESHGVLIKVSGYEQYAIARSTEFNPTDVDDDLTSYHYGKMIVTLSLPWDEYVEGIWPEELPEDFDGDAPRIKVIDAGPAYRKVYVAPGTVVDVDADGDLLRSTGGWLPKEDGQDFETHLQSLAKLSHAWFGSPHRVLTLTTHRLPKREDLDIGYLVVEIGDPLNTGGHREIINTVISQVTLRWPENEESPQMTFITDSGELDPMQTAGDPSFLHHAPREVLPASVIRGNQAPIA